MNYSHYISFIFLSVLFVNPESFYDEKECSKNELMNVVEWEISFSLENTYEQELDPENNHTKLTHSMKVSGKHHLSGVVSVNPDNAKWEGTGSLPVHIERESFTEMTNPFGAKTIIKHETSGSDFSDATIWFFINKLDNTYSFTIHDVFIEATTITTETYFLPDGTVFRENITEKSERFNLGGSIFDKALSGECKLSGSEIQGDSDNINHKKLEWEIIPVN